MEYIQWMQEKSRWKGLKIIGMIRKTITRGDATTVENRYYISSFKDDIDLFARTVREHWSVEIMHWHLEGNRKFEYRNLSCVCPASSSSYHNIFLYIFITYFLFIFNYNFIHIYTYI